MKDYCFLTNYCKKISESSFSDCEECEDFYFGDCPVHGPLFPLADAKCESSENRSLASLPDGLEVKESCIPNAGLGVFALVLLSCVPSCLCLFPLLSLFVSFLSSPFFCLSLPLAPAKLSFSFSFAFVHLAFHPSPSLFLFVHLYFSFPCLLLALYLFHTTHGHDRVRLQRPS